MITYQNDVSIEEIQRCLKKLEAGLSVLIGDDLKKINMAKMVYYSNRINYSDDFTKDRCRVTNEFYEFLQNDGAKKIEIDQSNDDVILNVYEMKFNLRESNHVHYSEKPTVLTLQNEFDCITRAKRE